MLVRLTSSTSGEMVMFAKHAHVLFEWIGKECTAHGVFTREQLPEAISRLRQGIEQEKQAVKRQAEEERAAGSRDADESDDDGKKEKSPDELVSLVQRAQPLLNLMQWTLREDGFILWEAGGDF